VFANLAALEAPCKVTITVKATEGRAMVSELWLDCLVLSD